MDKIELPNCLIPKYKTKLIRFGSEYDGGYLINENDIIPTKVPNLNG